MEDRAHALIATVFLIVFGFGAALVAWWMFAPKTNRIPYLLESKYSVSGLGPGSPVNYKGVQVGAVRRIELDPKNRRKIRVTIGIKSSFKLPQGTYASIGSSGLVGTKYVDLHLGKSNKLLKSSVAHPAALPVTQGTLSTIFGTVTKLSNKVTTTVARLNKVLSPANRKALSSILGNVDQATGRLKELEDNANKSLNGVPKLIQDVDITVKSARALIRQLNETAVVARGPLKQADKLGQSATGLTEQLRQKAAPKLMRLMDHLDELSRELRKLSRELSRHPSSLIYGRHWPRPGPGESGYEPAPTEQT